MGTPGAPCMSVEWTLVPQPAVRVEITTDSRRGEVWELQNLMVTAITVPSIEPFSPPSDRLSQRNKKATRGLVLTWSPILGLSPACKRIVCNLISDVRSYVCYAKMTLVWRRLARDATKRINVKR